MSSTMCSRLREELTVGHLSLDHTDYTAFCYGKLKNPTYYLAWRVFWAIYHSGWLVAGLVMTSLDDDRHVAKWFIYLSNWVYLLLTIDSWMECGIVLKERVTKTASPAGARPIPLVVRITWCLFTVSSVGCVMATLWYWTWIGKGKQLTALRLHYHGINALYVLLNFGVTRFPLRLLHVVYPVTFGVAYTAFSAIYFALEGTNHTHDPYIYKVLDWSKPGRTFALSSLSNFLFIPVVHVLLWLLRLLIERISSKMSKHDRIDNVPDSESEDHFNCV